MLSPVHSHPLIYKRGHPALPQGNNEASFFVWHGELLAICFNRPPLATEIVIYRVSDAAELARWPWIAAFGTVIVDSGDIHIFGSTSPSAYVPGNWVVHSVLDPVTFQPSPPVNAYQAPIVPGGPYTIPNSGVCKAPFGYLLAVDLFHTGNGSQGRTIFLKSTSLNGPWTRFGNPFVSADTSYLGAFKPFYVPDGPHPNRCYMVYNSCMGTSATPAAPYFMNIAYTDDFMTYTSYSGAACYLYPDASVFDGTNASDGSEPIDLGNGTVIIPYLAGDQVTWSNTHLGHFNGTLADLVAAFGF